MSGSDEWDEVEELRPETKAVTFFWFKDADLSAEEDFSSVLLRLYTLYEGEKKDVDIEMDLDEATDVFESQPTEVTVGEYEGALLVGTAFFSLVPFQVFPNRNRVVLKIDPDAIAEVPVLIGDNEQASESAGEGDIGDSSHLISESDADLHAFEDEDTANSSAEAANLNLSQVALPLESLPEELDHTDESPVYEITDSQVAGVDGPADVRLEVKSEEEQELNRMVRKYSKDRELKESNVEVDGGDINGDVNAARSTTPSTVIDQHLTPASTPRESEDGRVTELETLVVDLRKQSTEKDNEILRLKTDLLESQKSNRALKKDIEANAQQMETDIIKELKDENQKLKIQISITSTSQSEQLKEIQTKHEALIKEFEQQKQTVILLQNEKEDLTHKVEELQKIVNQSKTFTPIEEEGESVAETTETAPNEINSFPSHPTEEQQQHQLPVSNNQPENNPTPVSSDLRIDLQTPKDTEKDDSTWIPNGYVDAAEKYRQGRSGASSVEVQKRSLDNLSAPPDLSYTKSNISFLRERLGDLKCKNEQLNDRYSKLEESTALTLSDDSSRNKNRHGKEFGSLTDISVAKNPLEKFRQSLLADHADLLEATDREIDRVVDHLNCSSPDQGQHGSRGDKNSPRKVVFHTPAGNMSTEQRGLFMEQRRAALAELEEIRKNLASVKSELKNEEQKEFQWVRVRDGFGKLKKPSELFGSLVQTSEDKARFEQQLSASHAKDSYPPPRYYHSSSIEDSRHAHEWGDIEQKDSCDRRYKQPSSYSSTAESVVERQLDKMSVHNHPQTYCNGIESDSTEVLISLNPMPDPIASPLLVSGSGSGSNTCKSRRARSAVAASRNSSNSKRHQKKVANRSSSEDNSSDATVVSDDETGKENRLNGGTGKQRRNPDSLYEERLNKSYPSSTDVVLLNGMTNSAEDDESTIDGDTASVDGWKAYLPSKNSSKGLRSYGNSYSPKTADVKYIDLKAKYKPKCTSVYGSSNNVSSTIRSKAASERSLDHPRYYVPKVPSDAKKGDRVKFSRKGGKVSHGIIKYVGKLPGRNDHYLGVELESGVGKHDGSYHGTRLFDCAYKKGVFVSFDKIILCYGLS